MIRITGSGMSKVKEHFFEVQQERRNAWIQERLGNDECSEGSEAWEALANEYSNMMDAYADEAEYRWLERHSYNELYNGFVTELALASDLLKLGQGNIHNYTVCKMVYVHAVTLLESLIGTIVRTLVVSDKAFMANVASKIDDLNKGRKYSLKEIAEHPNGHESLILKILSNLTYHNPSTIKTVLHAVVGIRMVGLDLSEISAICDKRHDIVHRNGMTIDDEPIHLEPLEVQQAMNMIGHVASEIRTRIYEALNDQDMDSF